MMSSLCDSMKFDDSCLGCHTYKRSRRTTLIKFCALQIMVRWLVWRNSCHDNQRSTKGGMVSMCSELVADKTVRPLRLAVRQVGILLVYKYMFFYVSREALFDLLTRIVQVSGRGCNTRLTSCFKQGRKRPFLGSAGAFLNFMRAVNPGCRVGSHGETAGRQRVSV
jgi:hypothetical protein